MNLLYDKFACYTQSLLQGLLLTNSGAFENISFTLMPQIHLLNMNYVVEKILHVNL